MKSFQHKNIIAAMEIYEIPKRASIYIVLEYFDGQTLSEFIEKNGPLEPELALGVLS